MKRRSRATLLRCCLVCLGISVLLLAGCGQESPTREEPAPAPSPPTSLPSPTPTGAVLRLAPESQQIDGGQTTRVDLLVEKAQDLWAIEIELQFNSLVLQVQDADPNAEGIQISAGDVPAPDFVAENRVDNAAGTVHYALTQLPPHEPIDDGGLVASIVFRGISRGSSTLSLNVVKLATKQGLPILLVPPEGSEITVQSDAPPSPTDTVSPTLPPKAGIRHVVQSGDTLESIARRYGSSVKEVAAYNNIQDPGDIYVGQVIYIPTHSPQSP
jgi:LysM repeat protein